MSKEQIEEMARIASKCITSWLNNETPKSLPDYIAERLYNAGCRKQSECISVEERLPENGTRCLVYNKRGNDGGYDIVIFADGFYGEYGAVTHWMPLPEPPKMKGEKENV